MNLEHDQKVAILLNALGNEAVDPALSLLEGSKSRQIRENIKELAENPPPTSAVEEVLDDFERFFKFAIQAAGAENFWSKMQDENHRLKVVSDHDEPVEPPPKKQPSKTPSESPELEDEPVEVEYEDIGEFDVDSGPVKKFRIFKPTDDELKDLKKLHPAQIAGALSGERPKTIAIVLQCLSKAQNAAVIKLLPEEIHGDLLGLMIADVSIQSDLKRRIVRTVVNKALTVEQREEEKPDPMHEIAGVLREMPRELRNSMLGRLRQTDEENAERLQKLLYLFEDIVLYEDRSIQKILAEIDKGQLIVALQPASQEIQDRVLNNLSKRAKESLLEEMELLGKQPPDVITEAQSAVAEVIATLDQSDQLELE